MIRERAVFTELYFGMAWKAEHAISQALQPTHLLVSTFISLTIFVFFCLLSTARPPHLFLVFLSPGVFEGGDFVPGQNAILDKAFRHVAQTQFLQGLFGGNSVKGPTLEVIILGKQLLLILLIS
jgi:hypothetical protein